MTKYSKKQQQAFEQGSKEKKLYQEKVQANTEAVKFTVDPPGALEPMDDRRRRGMQRIAWRSKRRPNISSFVHFPMMNPGAVWQGATPDDFTRATFINRLDWEHNAPRFLYSPPSSNTDVQAGTVSEPSMIPMGMKDFWYDKSMYGKVNLTQTPIFVSETFLMSCSDKSDTILAPSFVAQAWRHFEKDWVSFWNRSTARGKSNTLLVDGGPFKPKEDQILLFGGWKSVHPLYNDHMSDMFSKFQKWIGIDHRRRKILTFKDFVQALLYFIDAYAPNDFLSLSAFIMSKKCPRAISGFQLEVGSGDPNDDILKKQTWLSDPNFEIWVAMLRKHGFSVDFNIPWRVVADVNSTPMRRYIRDYAVEGRDPFGVHKRVPTLRAKAKEMRDIGTERALELAEKYDKAAVIAQTKNLDMMFKTCYYRTDLSDLQRMMSYIIIWWNDYATAFPVERITTYSMNNKGPANQTITIEHYRSPIDYDPTANPSVKNLSDPYSLLAGKTIYRASGDQDETITRSQPGSKAAWDVWVNTFGSAFPAQFYLFIRAREAGRDWSQKRFEKYVKIMRELQKSLDGKAVLDYINEITKRLPSPGGNPMPRVVEHSSKSYNVYEQRERERAGKGMFMLMVK